jgi:AAHS family 4-hydroxybenzoate transporter-like MFS transporter
MAQIQTIDVSRLIDERKINGFNILVLVLCFFATLFDGYDITAAAFAGPSLIKAWGLTNMAAFGPVLSASLFGIFFGSALIGYVGDRWGRRIAIMSALCVVGVFTLSAMWAADLTTLAVLRFLAGIGIGGLLPTTIALNAEFAPTRVRATMIILMFTGVTFGGAIPGPVAAWLVPDYGWQALFFVGGIFPLLVAVAVALWLPESLKFLALKTHRRAEMVKIVSALSPNLGVTAETNFVVPDEKAVAFTPKLLFAGGLFWLTTLLWILFVCNQLAFYFVNSWLPTVLTEANIPLSRAVIISSLFQLGGTVGGLVLARPTDRYGAIPVCVLFVLSLFTATTIGFAREPESLLMLDIFFAGFALLGLQFGLNAISGMMYPTAFRSSGAGWALSVSRFGAIAGPIIGGILIARHLPIEQLYMFLFIPLTIGTVVSFVFAWLFRKRSQGMALGRQAKPAGAGSASG